MIGNRGLHATISAVVNIVSSSPCALMRSRENSMGIDRPNEFRRCVVIQGSVRDTTLSLASSCYSGALEIARRLQWGKPSIIYVGDSDWVLSTIGESVQRHLASHYNFGPRFAWRGIRHSVVHWGSPPQYFGARLYLRIHASNRQVVNWTHGQRSNPNPAFAQRLDNAQEALGYAEKVICHSRIGIETLLEEGIIQDKLVYIPHGIDTEMFRPPTDEERLAIRRELEIPETAFCIGSFQKDGEGMGEGLSPKWVKGPDVFLDVIRGLKERREICVLLTGPARGYVKAGLERMGVPYRHFYLKEYKDVARHFRALDAYVIASRDEGGPMALLESMASGVPLISTRVGMCIDLVEDRVNGFLADVEDTETLVARAEELHADIGLRSSLIQNGLFTARKYTWSSVAKRYHEEVYRPLTVEFS